ncbi:MAG: hypothetical protein JWQ28_2488 [Pedobacter sp.]|jgi:hypothetical protein|nr:hypothetical protein [Pedobacter sp.]
MKKLLIILLPIIVCFFNNTASAQVKPYLAVIHTNNETFKGLLYKASADSICIKDEQKTLFICAAEVKTIEIRSINKNSKYRRYSNYDPYNDRFVKVSKKMVPVRKWGEKDPTIEEELSGRIVTGFYNAALNGIASSLNLFGGSVSFMEINYNKENYYKQLANLNYHSIEHQLNPELNESTQQVLAKGN